MCGIVGYWDKSGSDGSAVGRCIHAMLNALRARGPDSAGIALYGPGFDGTMALRVKLGEQGDLNDIGEQITEKARTAGRVRDTTTTANYLRLVLDYEGSPAELEALIEGSADVEVVSMGQHLEIIKQVGSPDNLDATYGIARLKGTHGIGHTRLSTESRVDLSHSQPFWAHGVPDLAIVHNGHITNYHKLRRLYEQEGVKFYTENDSEILGVYIGHRLAEGLTLTETLEASLVDLDGSFSYLAATQTEMGFAKDPFALKPLLVAETDAFVAISNEEIAIRAAFAGSYTVREAQAKEVRVWQR